MAGVHDKQYFSNIKLINSVVKDSDGNQISLISDERLGVVNAVGGPTTAVNPLITQTGMENYVETELGNYNAGVAWRKPVKYFAYNYPVASSQPGSPVEGDTYVDSADAKLYTYTTGAWDAGVQLANDEIVVDDTTGNIFTVVTGALDAGTAPTDGDRFASLVDDKLYTYDTDAWDAGEEPLANWVIATEDEDKTYMYDLETTSWYEQPNMNSIPLASDTVFGKVQIGTNITVIGGVISVADASTTTKGVVELATDGETAAGVAVQGNDSRLLKGAYHNTYAGVTAFEVTHSLGTSKLLVQVWEDGEQVEAYIHKKTGSETSIVEIGLNQSSTVEVSVIAIP